MQRLLIALTFLAALLAAAAVLLPRSASIEISPSPGAQPRTPRDAPHPPEPPTSPPGERWLSTADITDDPSLRDQIDLLATMPVMADGVATLATCGTPHGDFRSRHPLPLEEQLSQAAFSFLEGHTSSAQRRLLARHEAPVVRAYFIPAADWPIDQLTTLASLLRDETCVPIGSQQLEFWGDPSPCVPVREQAATVLCRIARQNVAADHPLNSIIGSMVFDPSLGRGGEELLRCLGNVRAKVLAPLAPRLLASEDEHHVVAGIRASWTITDNKLRLPRELWERMTPQERAQITLSPSSVFREPEENWEHRRLALLPRLAPFLRHPSTAVRIAAIEVSPWSIASADQQRVLVAALADRDAEVRERAAFAYLRDVRPASEPLLLQLLRDPASSVRDRTLSSLTQAHHTPRLRDAVRELLLDEDSFVRGTAAGVLPSWPARDAVDLGALTQALAMEQNEFARERLERARAELEGRDHGAQQ